MSVLYSFLLYHYRWIILIAMLPYINLIRRYIFIRFGSITAVRTNKGTAIVRGFPTNKKIIRKYGMDALVSGICAVVICLSSLLVPYFHSTSAAIIEICIVLAMLCIYLIGFIRLEKERHDALKMMRNLNLDKILKMMEQGKKDSVKK